MALGFTQAQLDGLLELYSSGKQSESITIEGRSWSWSTLPELWTIIQRVKADIAEQSATGRKRFTFTTHNRGY